MISTPNILELARTTHGKPMRCPLSYLNTLVLMTIAALQHIIIILCNIGIGAIITTRMLCNMIDILPIFSVTVSVCAIKLFRMLIFPGSMCSHFTYDAKWAFCHHDSRLRSEGRYAH